MAATSPVKDFLVTYLMPEKCYREFFVSFHLHGEVWVGNITVKCCEKSVPDVQRVEDVFVSFNNCKLKSELKLGYVVGLLVYYASYWHTIVIQREICCGRFVLIFAICVTVPCLKFVLNRVVGFWILLDTFLAQLPQLLKILWRGSVEGLSLTSILLQLYAFSCPVVYAVSNNFPLFAWAERLFTLAQTATIIFLILHYRGDTLTGILLLLGYSGVMFLLGSYAATAVVSVMQASSLAALIASKALQTVTNHHNGHTGQLSSVSVLLSCAGSLGVLFVSLQETESSLASLSHILSACLSCVLLAQVLCCRSSTATATKKRE